MSARSSKPPKNYVVTSSTFLEPEKQIDSEKNCEQKPVVDCPCTNISIMQLFHEMKQKFPTVPDYIVNQCVTDNCHDRKNCIDCLEKEFAAHPNFVQAYPAQVLRKTTNLICKKPLVPTRPAPQPQQPQQSHQPQQQLVSKTDSKPKQNTSNVTVQVQPVQNKKSDRSDIRPQLNNCDSKSIQPQQRPKTLDLPKPPIVKLPPSFSCNSDKVLRPVRAAPPPPVAKQKTLSEYSTGPSVNTKLLPSPSDCSKCGDSEISVNISLSPSSEQSRHLPSLSTQTDAKELYLQNPRSITSVNLTLRQPSANVQSPIDITVGPGLTCSTSSFDTRRGYQKSFLITVTEGSEVIQTNSKISNFHHNMSVHCSGGTGNSSPSQESRNIIEESANSVISKQSGQISAVKGSSEVELIKKQRISKEHLVKILNGDKKRLERMQREISVLMTPVTPKDFDELQNEIDSLRSECKKMVQEIESAGQFDTSITNNDRHSEFRTEERNPSRKQRSIANAVAPELASPLSMEPRNLQSSTLVSLNTGIKENCYNNNDDSEQSWTCHMCTFRNHHSLKTCEQCLMPRISGSVTNYQSPLQPPTYNNQFLVCENSPSSDKSDKLVLPA